MQLLEYFLWKSIEINDKKMNYICSLLGFALILFQPIVSLRLLSQNIYNFLIPVYGVITMVYLLLRYLFYPINFKTTRGAHKHLAWNWLEMKGFWQLFLFIWFFCIEYTNRDFMFAMSAAIPFFYTYIKYRKSNEWGSIWCWLINSFCLFLLIDVLIISPYKKNEC